MTTEAEIALFELLIYTVVVFWGARFYERWFHRKKLEDYKEKLDEMSARIAMYKTRDNLEEMAAQLNPTESEDPDYRRGFNDGYNHFAKTYKSIENGL